MGIYVRTNLAWSFVFGVFSPSNGCVYHAQWVRNNMTKQMKLCVCFCCELFFSFSLFQLFLVLFCVWDIYMLNQFVIIEPSRHHHSVANQSSKSHFGTRIQRAQNALFYVPLGAFSCFKWNGFSSILSLIITISG